MTPRKLSLGLISFSLLTCALVAHAGEVSMDVRSMAETTEPVSVDQTRSVDNTSATSEVAAESIPTSRHPQWRTTTANRSQTALSDDPETTASSTGSSAGGAASSALTAPNKSRNRWQSLVPGAIK